MIFSIDNFDKQENSIDETPIQRTVIKVSETTSFYLEALHYLLEENITLEKALGESNLYTYTGKRLAAFHENNIAKDILKNGVNINLNVNGPFKGMKDSASDFFKKVKTNFTIENIVKGIITGFIKIITRLWKEFEIVCMNLVSKNSQIRRLSNKIHDLGVDIKYEQPMFIYTNIKPQESTSRTNLEEQLTKIYDEMNNFIQNFIKLKNPKDINDAINNFNTSKANDEPNYDKLRGDLLGSVDYISADDYNERLFKYFRNGSSITTTDNIIPADQIRTRLEDWNKAPKLIKSYERDKNKLEAAGNSLVAKLNASKVDRILEFVPAETLNLYSELVTRYCNRIKNTCSIFLLFYSARLDAAKDELALNTKILFRAAEYITREGL